MDPTGKCPYCGTTTRPFEDIVLERSITFQVACDKCRDKELERVNRERREELDRRWQELCPASYRATDPNHAAIDQGALAKLLEWDLATAGGKGIGLVGPTGGCKTRKMFLLLRKLHYQGVRVGWIRATDFSRASSEIFDSDDAVKNEARAALKNARNAAVLFIDDLGKERFTDRTELELYRLIEERISSLRPTLWTTNLRGADLRELMSENRGPTIIRRLAEFSTVCFVTPLHERANPIVHLASSARSA
jgi:DNA replication protein DnaC